MDRLHTNIVLRTTSRFKSIVLVFIVIISFQIPQHSFTSQTSRSLLEINAIIFPPLSVYQVLQHYLSIKSLRYTKRGLHKLSTITCNQSINQSIFRCSSPQHHYSRPRIFVWRTSGHGRGQQDGSNFSYDPTTRWVGEDENKRSWGWVVCTSRILLGKVHSKDLSHSRVLSNNRVLASSRALSTSSNSSSVLRVLVGSLLATPSMFRILVKALDMVIILVVLKVLQPNLRTYGL